MSQTKHEIVYRKTSDLIPYARNSRTHSDDQVTQIASSIREFGFTNPILLDSDNGIIAGHGRVMAAKKLALDEVPCIVLGYMTDAQKKAYVIADNKLALNAGWDLDMLSVELSDLEVLDFDLSLTGFSEEELKELLSLGDVTDEGLVDEDEVPEVEENPISAMGDVWVMGKHRLICGDSCQIDSVEKLVNGQLVDLLITDPPYNVDYVGKTKKSLKIQNDKMEDDSFRLFLRDAYATADAVMKPGASFYIWHADSEGYNFRGAAKDIGWPVRQCLIWSKDTMVMGRQDYHWQHEPCLYGWKEGAGHVWSSDRKQTTILKFERPKRSEIHPTMKPVALFRYQIENNTRGGDLVLDLFGGSGTTLIACEEIGRVARIVELDPRYVDVIVKRWQEFTGKEAINEKTGQTYNEMAGSRDEAA